MFCGAVLHIVPFHIPYAIAGFPVTVRCLVAFFFRDFLVAL